MRTLAFLISCTCALACSGGGGAIDAGTDAPSQPDVSAADVVVDVDASGPARLRLGNFATPPLLDGGKTSVPSIDLCIDGHTTPHFSTEVTPPVTGGLSQRSLSAYYDLTPGNHQASIVSVASGGDCSQSLTSLSFDAAPGQAITVALLGETDGGDVPLSAHSYVDQPSASVPAGQTLVRFVETSPIFTGVSVMSSEGDGGATAALFPATAFGDASNYLPVDMGPQNWTLTWTGANGSTSTPVGYFTTPDTVWTIFFYGRSTTSFNSLNQTQLFVCKDSANAQPLTPCTQLLLPPPHGGGQP